jgi:solute:Na+ symporter, SSS family
VLLTVISAVVTFYMDSITGAWQLLIGIGAGTGTVLILRWFWWRINAWSEVSAMSSAFLVSMAVRFHYGLANDDPLVFAKSTLITVGVTTVVWMIATFATAPEPQDKLISFYRRVRPSAALWQPIARLCPDVPPARDAAWNLLDWICGCIMIYSALFGIGKIVLKETGVGLAFLAAAGIAGAIIYWDLSRRGWRTVLE